MMKIKKLTIKGHRVYLAYEKGMRVFTQKQAQPKAEEVLRSQDITADGSRYGCLALGPVMVVASA
jgi:hypothetical protein